MQCVDAANHGHLLYDGQHLVLADFHGHGIGVAVGHQARSRAVARHPEAAGVVDDDQVDPALFEELRADAGASAGRDDRLASTERGV